jgi:hypothetical protein
MELEVIRNRINEIEINLTAMENRAELFAAMLDHYSLTEESYNRLCERNKIGLWQYFLKG